MKLNLEYATTLGNHPFGIALYQPPTTSEMKPGVVGYFDRFDCWNVIADLANQCDLELKDLHPPVDLVKARTNRGITWGPITSSSTQATKIDLSAGVSPVLGFPATVSAAYSYQNDEDVGAILLTSAPIDHERYYHTTPFKNWNNAERLCYPKPLKCAINMWTSKGKGVKIGFSADVIGAGHIGPGVDWYVNHADGGWGEYTAEVYRAFVLFEVQGYTNYISRGTIDASFSLVILIKFNFNQSLFKDPSLVPTKPIFKLMIPKYGEPPEDEDSEEHSTVPKYIATIPDPKGCHQEFEVYCRYIGETQIV